MKYIITSNKLKGKILFNYGLNGFIKSFEIESEQDVNEKFVKWLFSNFPYHEQGLESAIFKTLFIIRPVADDLSFKAFWEAYDYKVGNKKKTEKLWNALTDPERAQALAACPKYIYYLSTKTNMEQAYAETWLRNRRFENVY